MLFLVRPALGEGPLSVVLDGPLPEGEASLELPALPPGLVLDGEWLELPEHRYDSSLPFAGLTLDALGRSTHLLRNLLTPGEHGPEEDRGADASRFAKSFRVRFDLGLRCLTAGRFENAAEVLAGCGPGATPSGDDALVGAVLAVHMLRACGFAGLEETARALTRPTGNPLVRTFHTLALKGRVDAAFRGLVSAMVCGDEGELGRAARRVLGQGATSGMDLLEGFLALLEGRLHTVESRGGEQC